MLIHQFTSGFLILIESTTAIIWAAFVCFLVAFVFVVFVFYRQKRESYFRQKQAELGREMAEVEMKVLRSQMNPHFIFNALNSVYMFMEKNDLQNAGDYLLKVSALMRRVLENSLNSTVSLDDDMGALKLYIEIEQMRLQHSFQYDLQIEKDINSENTFVPPLILQPFVENAIWHGLNNQQKDGLLSIHIYKKDGLLHYKIEDNGVHEKEILPNHAALNGAKKKSVGLTITRERLEVLNKTKNTTANFTVLDKWDDHKIYAGKTVLLQLPLEEM